MLKFLLKLWGRADSTGDVFAGLQVGVPSNLVKKMAIKLTGNKQLALAA